jgi:MSHA biogenesis protein MshJ
MRRHFVKIAASIDRLSLRERLFVLAAGLVILGGIWEAGLAAPLAAREEAASEKVVALRDRLQQLDASIQAAANGMSEGMPGQFDRLRALRERVAAGDEEVRVFTTDLIDPAQMRLVLEELLRRQGNIELVSATNLPARPLVVHEDEGPAPHDVQGPQLYRHTLVLTLRGTYLDCLTYLQTVEKLPWQIYWSRLELAVDRYPRNDIVLELRTLSLDEEWIGV